MQKRSSKHLRLCYLIVSLTVQGVSWFKYPNIKSQNVFILHCKILLYFYQEIWLACYLYNILVILLWTIFYTQSSYMCFYTRYCSHLSIRKRVKEVAIASAFNDFFPSVWLLLLTPEKITLLGQPLFVIFLCWLSSCLKGYNHHFIFWKLLIIISYKSA